VDTVLGKMRLSGGKNWEIRELRKLGKLGKLRKSGKEVYYFRLKMMTGPHL
jgi:hypothetical protein